VTATTICGTDLHILKGDVPTVTAGRILGHEGVGIIEEVGASVSNFKVGAHVLISCIASCGKCANCKKGMYSHCENGGGWILGNIIDGTQAEYVRIPYADNSLYPVPAAADEEALVMLSDILPTGSECGVLNGRVKPGDTVAIVGAGPIGLAALLTAQFYAPAEIIMIDGDKKVREMEAADWVSLGDEKLLERRISKLGLRLEDTSLEPLVRQLYDELSAKGPVFHPQCYVGDEWFVPIGIPAIFIPFCLVQDQPDHSLQLAAVSMYRKRLMMHAESRVSEQKRFSAINLAAVMKPVSARRRKQHARRVRYPELFPAFPAS
jgi:hypothetical protein